MSQALALRRFINAGRIVEQCCRGKFRPAHCLVGQPQHAAFAHDRPRAVNAPPASALSLQIGVLTVLEFDGDSLETACRRSRPVRGAAAGPLAWLRRQPRFAFAPSRRRRKRMRTHAPSRLLTSISINERSVPSVPNQQLRVRPSAPGLQRFAPSFYVYFGTGPRQPPKQLCTMPYCMTAMWCTEDRVHRIWRLRYSRRQNHLSGMMQIIRSQL
jgi:hypothetical protein